MGRLLVAGLGVLLALGVAGCTVPANGITGITVDADGHLMGVFAWCDGGRPPDGATLYIPPGDSKVVARYRAPKLAGGFATLRLDEPADGWQWTKRGSLRPDARYDLFGWTEDNSWSTQHVEFRMADRDRLSPGMVLFNAYDKATEKWAHRVAPQAEFRQRAQDHCDD